MPLMSINVVVADVDNDIYSWQLGQGVSYLELHYSVVSSSQQSGVVVSFEK